tara:strand:- start:2025 stop:2384 length:360 start_codon:yes stop_codon:yes gene_type:complete
MQEKFYSSNYSECLKKKGTYISFGGGFLCDSELFRRLKGFDESYICWGGEDSQFFDRAARICKILRPSKKVITIHLWHEPFDKDKHIYEQRNREKYQKDKQRFKFGNENPCNINKGGWG